MNEKPAPEHNERLSSYLDLLRTEAGIEVSPGLEIDKSSYTVIEGLHDSDDFEVVVQHIIDYLNTPIIKDNFVTHAERIAWFNEDAERMGGKLYQNNKLRGNKIAGLNLTLDLLTFSKNSRVRDEYQRLQNDLQVQVQGYEYGLGSTEENNQYVNRYVEYLKGIFNLLIDEGLVVGNKV